MSLKFEIRKNEEKIKEINVSMNDNNFSTFRNKLHDIQRDVNSYLTSLIDDDKTG